MVKKASFLIIGLIILGAFGSGGILFLATRDLPNPELLENRSVSQSTKIYDRTGETLLYEIHGEEKRTIIGFNDVSDYLKKATLVTEDKDFYKHSAFDWKSTIRAFFVNLIRGKISQGGSTITQQLAKNAFLSPERTLIRKIKELILAFQLEKKYSKNEIFELYINQIPYGANSYGIEAASQTYFKKSAQDLTLAEAALLASLPKAPSYYSPWGLHVDELLARKNSILEKMQTADFISEEEKEKAKKYAFVFAPQNTGIKAPHFVIAAQEYLNGKYGEDDVRTAGLKVMTTLDWNMQQIAEKVALEGAKRNEELYKGTNAALVAQDAATGQILTMVGSRDYFDENIEGKFNVVTQGLRQPGSAIKPFVYLAALKKGFTPNTVLFDVPTEFTSNNPNCPANVDFHNESAECYHPENFDEKFRGPVTLREGLAQSINVPSVKILYLAGIDEFLKFIKTLGIETLTERSRYGLSLVLGGGEIKMIDLVEAYSVLAQNGVKHKQSLILEIKDNKNKLLEEYKDQSEPAADPRYIKLINDILSDREARSPLFTRSLYLTVFDNQEVALKTGTTNDYKDAWAFGYTPSLVVGVWAGNNDNQPMQKQGSSLLAAVPIWNAFMKEILKDRPTETFLKPDPIETEKPILRGEYPEIHTILYYINKKDPAGPAPKNPTTDPQFSNWEESIQEWIKNNPGKITLATKGPLISEINLNLLSPNNGSFLSNNQINIDAEFKSSVEINKLEIRFNNIALLNQNFNFGTNYHYKINLPVANPKLQNSLKITIWDINSNKSEKEIILYNN